VAVQGIGGLGHLALRLARGARTHSIEPQPPAETQVVCPAPASSTPVSGSP
jgi:hypothetical protein